jgi:transposase InsO family protein
MKLVESKHPRNQCELLCLNRSTYYYKSKKDDSYNIELMNLIDEEYTRHPYYGVRRMQVSLKEQGHKVNHKRIRRISRRMGIEAIYPKPKLTKPFSEHRKYPYLLRGLKIERPDHVWCSDITYIKTKYGFVYLTSIMDWFSRYVLSFEVSTSAVSGIDKYFYFYNNERPHQALEYKTPYEVYQNSRYETNFINPQDEFHDKSLHLKNTSILSL